MIPTNLIIETQKALNVIIGADLLGGLGDYLEVDGIAGNETLWAQKLFLEKYSKVLQKNRFEFLERGLHAIRMNDEYNNVVDDYFFVFVNGLPYFVPACTKPAKLHAIHNALMWALGKQGVACMVAPQQIKKIWKLANTGAGGGWSGLPFLWQDGTTAPCKLWRDKNADTKISKEVVHITAYAGINGHSWKGWSVNSLSYFGTNNLVIALTKGCQVTLQQFWALIVPIIWANNPDGFCDYTLTHIEDY